MGIRAHHLKRSHSNIVRAVSSQLSTSGAGVIFEPHEVPDSYVWNTVGAYEPTRHLRDASLECTPKAATSSVPSLYMYTCFPPRRNTVVSVPTYLPTLSFSARAVCEHTVYMRWCYPCRRGNLGAHLPFTLTCSQQHHTPTCARPTTLCPRMYLSITFKKSLPFEILSLLFCGEMNFTRLGNKYIV